MKNLTKITQLLVADMQDSRKSYESMFKEHLNISYSELSYKEFDRSLTLITKGLIDSACDEMKPVLYDEKGMGMGTSRSLMKGKLLLQLYISLQKFYSIGTEMVNHQESSGENVQDEFTVFHRWFLRAVAGWLDIALYRAMLRIVRAVEIDSP